MGRGNSIPIVVLSGLVLMIEAGADIEIETKQNAVHEIPNWIGEWYIYAVEAQSSDRFILVQGQTLVPKAIKTANSLIHHIDRLGYEIAILPLRKGQKITLTKEHRK